jgi:hypothetical protein
VDARVQDLLEAVDKDLPETVKGLWNWWHSRWMPQATSKKATGASNNSV